MGETNETARAGWDRLWAEEEAASECGGVKESWPKCPRCGQGLAFSWGPDDARVLIRCHACGFRLRATPEGDVVEENVGSCPLCRKRAKKEGEQ